MTGVRRPLFDLWRTRSLMIRNDAILRGCVPRAIVLRPLDGPAHHRRLTHDVFVSVVVQCLDWERLLDPLTLLLVSHCVGRQLPFRRADSGFSPMRPQERTCFQETSRAP